MMLCDDIKILSKFHVGVNPLKLRLIDDYFESGTVLDAGCGNGLYGHSCVMRGASVIQVDVYDRRDVAAKNIEFIAIDVAECSFADGSVGNVIAFDLIEHLDDDVGFLKKAYAWMRGGVDYSSQFLMKIIHY